MQPIKDAKLLTSRSDWSINNDVAKYVLKGWQPVLPFKRTDGEWYITVVLYEATL
jgi:hypothetical protein